MRRLRSWLPRNRDQFFNTGNALSNISLRVEGLMRAVQALVAAPSAATWTSALIATAVLVYSIWGFTRTMRAIYQDNTKDNPSDANQNGLSQR